MFRDYSTLTYRLAAPNYTRLKKHNSKKVVDQKFAESKNVVLPGLMKFIFG